MMNTCRLSLLLVILIIVSCHEKRNLKNSFSTHITENGIVSNNKLKEISNDSDSSSCASADFSAVKVESLNSNMAIGLYSVKSFNSHNSNCWFALREYAYNINLDRNINEANIYFVDTIFINNESNLIQLFKFKQVQRKVVALFKYSTKSTPKFVGDPFGYGIYQEKK